MTRQSFLLVSFAPAPDAAQAGGDRPIDGPGRALAALSGARIRAGLEELREEFPFLAAAAVGSAAGDGRVRPCIDLRTRHLAAVAASAVTGDRAQLRIHADHALDSGVGQVALKEIVYLTAAQAGLSRAIDVARTLSELFAERWEAGRPVN